MPFRYMGNFKAIAIDYEYYLSLSDKPVSVCLTERQMYILSAWNTYTSWFTRWYNTDDTSEAQIRLIAAELEDLLMCGCGVPVPSITDRFNTQNYVTTTSTTYQNTYNTWNTGGQTVSSIAPALDYSTGDPGDIDKILCLALQMLVTSIVEAAKANKQGTEQDNQDFVRNLGNVFGGLATAGGAAIQAGGAAAAFVGYIGGPYLVLGLALAAVGMAIANAVWTTDLSVFEDDAAVQQVYCTMINNIVGDTPTRSRFQNGLTPNTFTPGSHAAQLAVIVQAYLDDLDTYLQFLATTQGLYEVANFGVLPECDSCGGPWCFIDDLEFSNGGFVRFGSSTNGDWVTGGEWGNGWYTGIDNTAAIRQLYIEKTLPSVGTFTKITVSYDYRNTGPIDASARPIQITLLNGATTVINQTTTLTPATGTVTNAEYTWEGAAAGNKVRFLLTPTNKISPPTPSGNGRIFRIKYEGTDNNPFGVSNC
jgi:hypothetical protein